MHLILPDYLGERHQLVVAPRSVGTPDLRRRSRRFSEMGPAPAYALRDSGLASRRRESDGGGAPSLPSRNEGASRFGAAAPCVSVGRGAAPSGPLSSGGASRRFSEMGAWQSLRAVWVHKKRGAVASPSMRNFELESRDS